MNCTSCGNLMILTSGAYWCFDKSKCVANTIGFRGNVTLSKSGANIESFNLPFLLESEWYIVWANSFASGQVLIRKMIIDGKIIASVWPKWPEIKSFNYDIEKIANILFKKVKYHFMK